jgi:hypothetical protein
MVSNARHTGVEAEKTPDAVGTGHERRGGRPLPLNFRPSSSPRS